MFQRHRKTISTNGERGQVLAEAVIVTLMLVVLIGALHQTGRWQFEWSAAWLKAQVAATAVALNHLGLPNNATVTHGDLQTGHNWVMRDFQLGHSQWRRIEVADRFAKPAWRPAGTGQASQDEAVTTRLSQAPRLWARHVIASQAVIYPLLPAISAVQAPWESRGSATDWLSQWQGSTPEAYLSNGSR